MFQRTGDRQARKLRLRRETMRTLTELGPRELEAVVSGYRYKPTVVCAGDECNGGGNSVRC
jgi:hypothetical protein